MKLPNFKNLSIGKKEPPSNYFLTLTIGEEKADAVIFQETLRRAKAIGHSREYFDKNIDSVEDESLLNVLDKVISTAEKSLPSNIETQNTIFGVNSSWVESGKIKKEHLLRLKKISDELELKPIGFIVTTEAICHFLQKEEGAPISAILVEIGKKYLTATLLRGGRIIESKTAELSGLAPEILDGVLKHFSTPEVLPSRIIIFGENDEKVNQEFIGFQWSKSLPFLHLPQITPLESSLDAKSVFYGAANQMNFIISDVSAISYGNIAEISDIAENAPILNTSIAQDTKPEQSKSDQDFGFLEGEDVSKNSPPVSEVDSKILEETKPQDATVAEKIEEIPQEMQVQNSESKSFPSNALAIFSAVKPTFSRIFKNLKLPANLPPLVLGRGKFIIIPVLLIGIFILFIFYYLLFRSATVTISVSPKSAQQTQGVTFGEDLSTDASAGTIKGTYVTVSEDGKLSTPATGKKQTGDPAKGTVTIFNLNQDPKTYSAGTVITSSNNLNYTLDNSVTVATGSSDPTNPSAGTADVNVTASSFGTQYNLPSSTKFSIGNDPLVAAKNDNAFSGGTSKDITVVSQADLDKLTSDTTSTLQGKAKQDIGGKITSDEILLPQFVSTSFDTKSFSQKVGDQVSSVNLTATISFKYITYSKDDLAKFAQNLFGSGDNLVINKDATTADASNLKIDSNNHTTATLNISTSLIPNLNSGDISKAIAGKSFNDAQDYVSKISQVNNVSISLSPNPIFLPKILPSSPSKIKIVVNTNG